MSSSLATILRAAVICALCLPVVASGPATAKGMPAGISITPSNRAAYTRRLPTGRWVAPVGTISRTPDFPTKIAVGTDGVAVLANGPTRAQTVTLFDSKSLTPLEQLVAFTKKLSAAKVAKIEASKDNVGAWPNASPERLAVDKQSLFQGLAAGSDGMFYAAGGDSDDVVALQQIHGKFVVTRRYPLTWQAFPRTQYPYDYQGEHDQAHLFYPDAVAVGPGRKHLYATGLLSNSLARIDIASGQVAYRNVGAFPFGVTMADSGRRLVVSDWGGNGVTVLDRARFAVVGRIATGPRLGPASRGAGVHPTALAALPGTPMCFVADSNVDRVVEVDTRTLSDVRVFDDSPYRNAPMGSYPDGLAVARGRLFVANAGNDDLAVFDIESGRKLGLVPTGWYPTDVAADPSSLFVVCAKGLGSGPNVHHEWVGEMMDGLVQRIDLERLDASLPRWTALALANDGFSVAQRAHRRAANAAATAWLRRRVRYVVFILHENKTFDEDLGAYAPAGRWADPHLDLFDRKDLPNLYSWAHDDTLFANFMADGEVTAQGHEWTTGTSDSDWVQRTWPVYYSNRHLEANPGWTQSLVPRGAPGWGSVKGGAENPMCIYQNLSALGHWSNPWIAYPGRLYLFDDLLAHHVPFEDFGEFVSRSRAGDISRAMHAHLGVDFPGWDRMILDTYRAKTAISWLDAHRRAFPRFVYIWLPDDHTAGQNPCYYTPATYVANNDRATAEVVHYLSTTPQWKQMAVFITQDDAQSGADHIDAHRTLAVALGPWVKRGYLDTHRLSQLDIVRTTEAILGLPPMSQWDANGSVFGDIWTNHPDFRPVPVLPMLVKPAINPGQCSPFTRLRQKVGTTGHFVSSPWFKEHAAEFGAAYTPTSLLTVPGPEQMRQEWIATKGMRRYEEMMRYLAAYSRAHKAPLSHYVASEDD